MPIRAQVVVLGEEDHALLLCVHHIAADGWSVGVLRRELAAGYEAALTGAAGPVAGAVQYIDYAHWQRRWLSGARQAAQLSYWQRQLADLPPLLALPTDRARPAVQRYVGENVAVTVPTGLVGPLKALAQAEGASLFMVLLAAFQAVLWRYSGQSDIAVGSPVANRPRGELEGLIGFFVNTLVLRSEVRGSDSFRGLLGQVREHTLAAYDHADIPFEQLVEALQPARSLSHSPLFQVLFDLRHAAVEAVSLGGLAVTSLQRVQAVAKFDLTLNLEERGGSLSGQLSYSSDLFEAASMVQLWGHSGRCWKGCCGHRIRRWKRLRC